jgi:prepilin-type N-terminal cleavage/methylation domain-containing protein
MRQSKQAFTLIELLAATLILAVLAGLAIPLYLSTRRSAAAKVCRANIASIATAESAWGLRTGKYIGVGWDLSYQAPPAGGDEPSGGLLGAPEGFAQVPHCPLDGASYVLTVNPDTGDLLVECPNAPKHASDTGQPAALWQQTFKSPGRESAIP